MKYRLDKISGNKLSCLGFGCMRFPTDKDGQVDKAATREMLELAYHSGVTYFDTAYPYHNGTSERITSDIMKQFPRDTFTYATKLPCWDVHSLDDAKKKFAEQLARLQTDYIDLYLLHALNKDTWKRMVECGVVEWGVELKKQGKIRKFGFSFHDDYDTFNKIVHYRKWDFCQIQLNYMDTDNQAGMQGYKDCVELGIPVVIMEPVKGGSLATFPDEVMKPLKEVNPTGSPASWAVRYVGTMPNTLVVLSGMSSLDQVKDNLATFKDFKPLSDEESKVLAAHVERIRGTSYIGCTHCNYCMPCPNGVNIPRIFALWNNYAKYHNAGDVKWNWEHEIPAAEKPANCIACGECESHCPQHLSIIDGLKEAQKSIEKICSL
jgi:predicted aldo/keto reductase-like oxidoreductase